ncbi:MAG: MBL fold metallo-hydrolase [Anaerolineaceae bacterium]
MQITILGAGTAIPTINRSPTSILFETGITTALIDIGPGTLQRAALHNVDYLELRNIFLTHLHPDHTLDLVSLLQINESTPEVIRTTPLDIFGCSGTMSWFDSLMVAFPGLYPSTYSLSISEFGKARRNWEDFQVTTMLTHHTDSSLAYRFDHPEGSFVFTGDAIFSDELSQLCSGVDLLISECSFPADWKTTEHMNSETVGYLAKCANPKHLVLTHLYPPAINTNIKMEIAKQYQGEITMALDGAKFLLNHGSKNK